MAFDPAFLDELRARTPIAAVVGRKTKLVRSGRQFKACCPFHGEKTPSFYVYEDHFHCFGCGVHGDAISFVMQAEGRSFLEAVEALAGEAGLEVPKQAPVDRARAERAKTLADVLDAAQASYVRRLQAPEGREGLAYLRGRALSDATIADHGLGWSGDGRGSLMDELRQQGFAPELIAEAGLMRVDEHGRAKGELFFNRVTFPIRDRRGGLVSFGGRTLGDGQPKYLNGPETPLFVKRRTLFGLDRASAALRTVRPPAGAASASRELVVVEGYMDVIALHQAGFTGAVAPLGTALTAEQLEALWRVAAAPVLCFDGDAAGRRAAIRAAETALPLLDPERTLRFVRLPEGEDPDSLVRRHGVTAMETTLKGADSLENVLFALLSEGSGGGPEQRARLHTRLVEAAATIQHKALSSAYRKALLDRFFKPATGRTRAGDGTKREAGARVARSAPVQSAADAERLRLLVAILLRHPDLLHDVEQAFCRLQLPPGLSEIRTAMLDWAGAPCGTQDAFGREPAAQPGDDGAASPLLDSGALIAHLHSAGLSAQTDNILSPSPLPLAAVASADAMPAEAEEAWWQIFGFVNAGGLREQVAAAQLMLTERWDRAAQKQLILLKSALQAVERGEQGDESD